MHTPSFHPADWVVLCLYFVATMGIGAFFYRKTRNTEGFTAANHALPGWVCGLSIFATFLSSISYLALPGKSFAGNWNPFVFSLSIPLVTWIAVRWFLPYYRNSGQVSAYAALETRFGVWARVYASVFYLLTQIARIAVVLYLMALPMQVLFGWDIQVVLVVTGICVTFYAFVGGILAVIWTDAIQAIVLMAGAVLCLGLMLANVPGGLPAVIEVANSGDKFSLGDFGWSTTKPTFWVVLVYGIVINLQNFGIDQSYVQRYVASSSDREAKKSLWLGGLLYVPVSALFFLIGTTLFVYYGADRPQGSERIAAVENIVARQRALQSGLDEGTPEFDAFQSETAVDLDLADIGDRVFPHFIGTSLPPGMTGLLIAAVFAAAMSTVSTSLNSSATLIMSDFYRRFVSPWASEQQQMRVLYAGTILWGILGTLLSLVLVRLTQSALDMWWTLSGIFGGGMCGLFLLGMISRRVQNTAAVAGVVAGVSVILWLSIPQLTAAPSAADTDDRLHAFLIPVIGTTTIILVGFAVGIFFKGTPRNEAT
ncbi:sodium:solute symporter [Crateriforma spongiae]|uniref:sodium:solute symporter n=1 Tax=Crateriforma spongiae TaxID=2724528 RepID=UPI001447BAA5|nr:sodium:solute symporter [Crateriforma spongiae]